MTPKLSEEQRVAIEQEQGRPVKVVDPATQSVFYLITGDQFSQIRCLLESEPFDNRDTYAAQDRALRGVWEDPALDVYNEPDTPQSS